LHIINGTEQDAVWEKIKGAIEYAKKYPGRNILGLSIHAAGDFKPMKYQGETWKGVSQFADVKSVDIVPWPARGGKFEEVLSESEKKAIADASEIFQTLKTQVGGLTKTGAPGIEEVRRIVDQLGTALKFNKLEDGMDPNDLNPGAPKPALPTNPNEQAEACKVASEALKVQAETEVDAVKKASFLKASETLAKMAEGSLTITHAPEAPGQAEDENESEDKNEAVKNAEAKQAEAESKYLSLFTQTLLQESGLSEPKKNYLKTIVLEGEKDPEKIKEKIAAYQKVEFQESDRGRGHGFLKPEQKPSTTGVRTGLKKFLSSAVKG
jgi:hypothetical protein